LPWNSSNSALSKCPGATHALRNILISCVQGACGEGIRTLASLRDGQRSCVRISIQSKNHVYDTAGLIECPGDGAATLSQNQISNIERAGGQAVRSGPAVSEYHRQSAIHPSCLLEKIGRVCSLANDFVAAANGQSPARQVVGTSTRRSAVAVAQYEVLRAVRSARLVDDSISFKADVFACTLSCRITDHRPADKVICPDRSRAYSALISYVKFLRLVCSSVLGERPDAIDIGVARIIIILAADIFVKGRECCAGSGSTGLAQDVLAGAGVADI